MNKLKISHHTKIVDGKINLPTSKSISNRLLIINALANKKFEINNLAESDDTQKLIQALSFKNNEIDVGAAGTTSRFLTAILAITEGEWIIKGTERLHQRPIKPLVDALTKLGAEIKYLKKNGCLPLKINGKNLSKNKVAIEGNISSQFITALLLIAPELPNGLSINFTTKLVSVPFIKMTLALMQQCGINFNWHENNITIHPGVYASKEKTVEADWSAASYLYSIAALAKKSNLTLNGLHKISMQGDAAIFYLFQNLGVKCHFENKNLMLQNTTLKKNYIEIDFKDFPDMAQTIIVVCAALNVKGIFKGLSTLRVKETDRIAALQIELQKLGSEIFVNEDEIELVKGINKNYQNVEIETYHDHRMALAFTPLALVLPNIIIKNATVVNKSYPNYWKDLQSLGFLVEEI